MHPPSTILISVKNSKEIHLFIYSFNKSLLRDYYVPHTLLASEDTAMNKTDKNFAH